MRDPAPSAPPCDTPRPSLLLRLVIPLALLIGDRIWWPARVPRG
ncbi:hypothetical protein [Brachybacterium sillae]|nr:hypothetical protein [Brachybacterium sillae]